MPRHLLLVFTLAGIAPAAAGAAVIDGVDVTVRVYDGSRLPAGDLRAALSAAAAILRSGAVDVRWVACRQDDGACDEPMRRGELAVRLVRSGIPRQPLATLPLGDALVDPRSGGVLATVHVDRVEWLARAAGAGVAMLAGRAIAHELGHLLLASRVHGPSGLMRAVWSQAEIRRTRSRDWRFTPSEARRIRARAADDENIVWGTE